MKDVKLIGLMPVFNEGFMVRSVLENNLKLVDEMIISEGPFRVAHVKPENDKTREVIEEYRSHSKVSGIIDNIKGPNSGARARTLTKMLQMAKYNAVDNWVLLCAGDCFYSTAAMQEIRGEISKLDAFMLRLSVLTFAIDFKHYYRIGGGVPYLFRISEGMRIVPGEQPFFKDGPFYTMHKTTRRILSSCPLFHYTWLKPFSCLMNKFYHPGCAESHPAAKGKKWLNQFYLSYEDAKAEEYYVRMREEFGRSTFYFRSGGRLKIYEGVHPSKLDNHPFRHIDVRTVKDNFDKRIVP